MLSKHVSLFYTLFICLNINTKVSGQSQWTLLTSCANCNDYKAVTYGDGLWITVGDNGKVLTSTDGIVWTGRISNTNENLRAIAYRTNQWVAVGTNGVTLTSVNGVEWTVHTTDPANELDGVEYGSGLWIAVGKTNNIPAGYSVMFTSFDGISWINQPIARQLSYQLDKIKYINGTWYLVGGDLIATSVNGLDWQPQHLDASFVTSIAYGSGLFVAGVLDVGFATSKDGISWITRRISTSMRVNDVSYGDGYWIAVGSPYTGGYAMLTSADGISWIEVKLPTSDNINSVRYANGRWVAVGRSFTILTSPPLLSTPLSTSPISSILLRVYPNPGLGVATIESELKINNVSIFSVTGRLIEFHEYNNSIDQLTLDFTNKPAGSYFIKLHTSNDKISTLSYKKY